MSQRTVLRRVLLLAVLALTLPLSAAACATRTSPTPSGSPMPSATPLPTATEPILPHPPTAAPAISSPSRTAAATSPPQLLDPTAAPTRVASATSPPRTPDPPAPPTLPATQVPASPAPHAAERARLGAGAGTLAVTRERAARLGLGWYLNWAAYPDAYRSPDVEYVPMIRVREGKLLPDGETLLAAVDALPGALWLIGNEPDVRWQDNTPPEAYAAAYHQAYTLLKGRDPTARVAIGGVSQPTPLRLAYLDRVLAAYEAAYGEPMPVDVWNVHNFILREERDSWGVDIPPGLDAQTGRLYEIADHDDLQIFRQQLVDFRRWMKARGQQDKPLIVTEYGILMPNEYGFPPERVEQFMLDTFEFMRTAADPALGYPADRHRLVQRWCWFSISDERYPTGNLLVPGGTLTPLGQAFAAYAAALR